MTRVLRSVPIGIAAAVLLFLTTPSHGSLIGDSVTCAADVGINCLQASATVGAGPEFSLGLFTPAFVVDIGDSTISLQLDASLGTTNPGSPNSFTLGDLDDSSLDPITGVAVSITNVTGLTSDDVTFTADSVTIDLGLTNWSSLGDPDSLLVIRLVFGAQQVPTPATLILLAAGLGLAAWRRRR